MLGYPSILFFFFFNDTATTEIYTLSLHDALPICSRENRTLRLRCISTSRCKAFLAPPASPATTPRVRLPSAPSVTSAASPSRGRSSHHGLLAPGGLFAYSGTHEALGEVRPAGE